MAAILGIIAPIATIVGRLVDAPAQIKQYVLDPIKAQFSYLFHYINIVKGLRDQDQKLDSTTTQLLKQIQADEDTLRIISFNVWVWCERVCELKEKIVRNLEDEPRIQNDTCLTGTTCPNLKLRNSRSREAEKLTKEIDELLNEYEKFGSDISVAAPVMGTATIRATSGTSKFDSRKQIEEDIMNYLRDHSISMIEVWGMGGVGKTTMAEKLGKRAFEEKQFSKIVKAVVSQQVDKLKIQQDLALGLGLTLTQGGTVAIHASQLQTRLKDEKVLIILDDVWKWLDLMELGIPSQIKILLTTRDHGVCKMMSKKEATRILNLEVLRENEAFSLFRENAGDIVDEPNIHPLAVDLARECNGMPLALVIVGRSLREVKDESIWKDYLRQLQKAAPKYISEYLANVFRPLELSYKHLETDEARYIFLLCCLFPEDSKIDIESLVRFGVGLNIFSAIDSSIYDARNEVNCIIKKLIDRCLLIDAGYGSWPTYVKMHDVIRDMAISIVSSGEHVFRVKRDKSLTDWLEKDSCTYTLTESMPRLDSLLMIFDFPARNPKVPIGLFNGMANLISLSICGEYVYHHYDVLSLSFLPSLIKLRVLHLHQCYLEEISFIGQLVNLEILSCRRSNIQELPSEIGSLTKLTLLDLTDCTKLKNIAPGVISKLDQLEELRLMRCPIEWECKGTGIEKSSASLDEVFSLKNLRFLEVWIQDLKVISQEMDYLQKLTSYYIVIGQKCPFVLLGSYSDLKRMSVCVDERRVFSYAISILVKGVKELKLEGNGCKVIIEMLRREGFKNITSLQIDRLGDVKILVEHGNFPILRHLELSNMNDFEEICYGRTPEVSFSQLQVLSLKNLDKLMYFCKCPSQKFSLSKVKEITIQRCAKLKWLFPLSVAESLWELQIIKISDCPIMEEVFKDENEQESSITTDYHLKFPNLNIMKLHNLPRLGALCKAVGAVIEFPSIKNLSITEVSLQKLFRSQLEVM